MAVRARRTAGNRRNGSRGSIATVVAPSTSPGLAPERVGEVLGKWQRPELRIARGFGECRDLTVQELEDIYQDTVEVLLQRRYASEDHLRHALRAGLKHRALHFHRDEGRREEILAESSPTFDVPEQAGYDSTERAALIREDRLVVAEFLTELSPLEQRVFWLLAEGMKYRLIAKVLSIEVNAARNTARSCERKREHFQLLYDTGRLCGYRAATIHALQAGESTSQELAQRAFAHLEGCASCRAEHRTNAMRLRRRFQGQAAILLPMPVFMHRLGWLVRLDARARTLQHRFAPDGLPLGPGSVRERAAALLAGGGAAAKLAAGVATVAVIAGGTIGATHVLDHKPASHHRHADARLVVTEPPRPISSQLAPTPPVLRAALQPHRRAAPARRGRARFQAHRRASSTPVARASSPAARREPSGFAYLGVPTESSSTGAPAPARPASHSSGGPFSP
ncbi:MAG TPA: sigma-70 family RNA polymerase sigma factor [Solirubrobacteraceae bacterium]|jgi:DNA-directed RNA polymerase specialized sigma24 family protein|nr:sigma-70 family RNA polymerase sigma factor [Solirubrobacteraceae bacterium]